MTARMARAETAVDPPARRARTVARGPTSVGGRAARRRQRRANGVLWRDLRRRGACSHHPPAVRTLIAP